MAIIAVLVAIAIPLFTAQLEKAKDATSVANMRSAYAEAQVAYLEQTTGGNVTSVSTTEVVVSNVKIESGASDNWSGEAADLPFTAPNDTGTAGTYTMTFTYENSQLKSVSMSAATTPAGN